MKRFFIAGQLTIRTLFVLGLFCFLKSFASSQSNNEAKHNPIDSSIKNNIPVLSEPENNSSAISRNPTLSWIKVQGATAYELEMSSDSTFKKIEFISGEIADNSKKCHYLSGDTKYYWRVRSICAPNHSDWSIVWNFRTSILGPSTTDDVLVVKENLGPNVNSEYSEFNPIISPDGKTLYICRDNHPENLGDKIDHLEDIWYCKFENGNKWGKAIHMGEPLNNNNNNFVCSVTPDGNTLLLGNSYKSNTFEGCSLSHRTKEGWSYPEDLKIKNYHNLSKYSNFSLSNDGKTLLMSIEREDSYGKRDIYVSFLKDNSDNEWSEPINLGNKINSSYREVSPFLASDGVTLYFSSDIPGGRGDLDVYVSRRLDNTWRNWTKPENFGPVINTGVVDAFFTIPASGDYAYMTTEHNSFGEADIIRVKLPPDIQPKPVVLICGKILNKNTKQPLEAKVRYEILPQGNEIGIARSNPTNGEYKLTLPSGSKYGFRAEVQGFFPINDYIDASNINKYTELKRDLYLVPVDIGATVRLSNIFFEFNKSDLKPESFPELNRVVRFLSENPSIKIEISGHTDDVGSIEYNQSLSESRAKSVVNYIINHGIFFSRIQYKGYGKTKPVADNSSEEGKQLNRRVEFVILKK